MIFFRKHFRVAGDVFSASKSSMARGVPKGRNHKAARRDVF